MYAAVQMGMSFRTFHLSALTQPMINAINVPNPQTKNRTAQTMPSVVSPDLNIATMTMVGGILRPLGGKYKLVD